MLPDFSNNLRKWEGTLNFPEPTLAWESFATSPAIPGTSLWQLLVRFQVRGAPREGQGDPGGQGEAIGHSNTLETIGKPMKISGKPCPKSIQPGKFPDGPFQAIKQMRSCFLKV